MKKKLSFPTNRKATLTGKNATVDAILKDISLTHAGVITPRGASKGTELELSFEVPAHGDFTQLNINCFVIHRHNVENDIYLKLEFEPLTAFTKDALNDFLEYKQRLRNLGKRPDFFER